MQSRHFRFNCLSGVLGLLVFTACESSRPSTPTLKNDGEVCAKDDECKTGLCDAAPGTQTSCVRKCADGCLANEICEQLTEGRFSCVKDRGALCTTCVLDVDCPYPADKCIVVDGKNVCGRDCAFNQNCPTSYRCLQGLGSDGKAKAQQCTPMSGSCTCTAATGGQMVSCTSTNSSGSCSGFRTCDGKTGFDACSAKVPEPEICNGIDDDCDGKIDESVMPLSCGVGACQNTIDSCTDGGARVCKPLPASIETCNGIDDDCDGVVDNSQGLQTDAKNCGKCGNVCALANASQKCVAGTCGVLACNLGFANCNNIDVDGCEVDTRSDSSHCGQCGKSCTVSGASGACVNGACQHQCAVGYVDLDGDQTNGCEYACTVQRGADGGVPRDVPDVNITDVNCDGFDGEIANGVFVSDRTGDDLNSGEMASPVQTIQRGVQLAVQLNLPNVYVAQPLSSYPGPLDLTNVKGKVIAGGYAVATPRWTRSAMNSTVVLGGNPALVMNASHGTVLQYMSFVGDDAVGTDSNGNGRSSYAASIVNTVDGGLQAVTLKSGRGAAGNPGSAGNPGATQSSQFNGSPGGPAVVDTSNDLCGLDVKHPGSPAQGAGGVSTCGGGKGGLGGVPGFDEGDGESHQGKAGESGVTATPGGTGQASENGTTVSATGNGRDGAAGANGQNGSKSPLFGTISSAGYAQPSGGLSTSGLPGNGGGGGGGGGGGCQNILGFFCCTAFGSAGGGGGAGGCGGGAGGRGGSGGASIALFMWNSSVLSARGLDGVGLTLRSGTGGNGGAGGAGGTPGAGGTGGASHYPSGVEKFTAGIGGAGGNGGPGGAGGNGAGGTGGSAFGYLHDANSKISTSLLNFNGGASGLGGPGGNGAANGGPDGQTYQDKSL